MPESLPEDHVAMLRDTLLQLLLQITAAVLVFAQGGNLALKILKASACKSVDFTNDEQLISVVKGKLILTFAINVTTLVFGAM